MLQRTIQSQEIQLERKDWYYSEIPICQTSMGNEIGMKNQGLNYTVRLRGRKQVLVQVIGWLEKARVWKIGIPLNTICSENTRHRYTQPRSQSSLQGAVRWETLGTRLRYTMFRLAPSTVISGLKQFSWKIMAFLLITFLRLDHASLITLNRDSISLLMLSIYSWGNRKEENDLSN